MNPKKVGQKIGVIVLQVCDSLWSCFLYISEKVKGVHLFLIPGVWYTQTSCTMFPGNPLKITADLQAVLISPDWLI